jgi:hypothetical protein
VRLRLQELPQVLELERQRVLELLYCRKQPE